MTLAEGTKLGPYEVVGPIGAGGELHSGAASLDGFGAAKL
jgi:hypothetical protein